MTQRMVCPPVPGPLEDYALRFDDLFSSLAQRRGFRTYLPASRLPNGKADPTFRTKPQIAVELVDRALSVGVEFRAVVADSGYGDSVDSTVPRSRNALGVLESPR
ncbi:MAG: transposase [Actinobacteria bacterium]|nr:transposase [Actinomycetota bacterium]